MVFDFPAKSGQRRVQSVGDPEAIAAIEAMRRRRSGPEDLLAYREGGAWRDVRSTDVNAYIQEQIGDGFSAKDFRTWSGTVLAAAALAGEPKPKSEAAAKRHDHRGRRQRRGGARQHARGLPPLLHRPARLRPLPRRASRSRSASRATAS